MSIPVFAGIEVFSLNILITPKKKRDIWRQNSIKMFERSGASELNKFRIAFVTEIWHFVTEKGTFGGQKYLSFVTEKWHFVIGKGPFGGQKYR
jgi:hypothetical protein